MAELFVENLQKLDFDLTSGSVRRVGDLGSVKLSLPEVVALETASRFKADAVYFRQFADNRPPQPQIYIYDNTKQEISTDRLAKIHRDLWSNSRIPIFLEIRSSDIAIFDTKKPVEILGDGSIRSTAMETLSFAADAVERYSRTLFDTGFFWESEQAKGHFLESTSAHRDLIQNLRFIRTEFLRSANLPEETAHKVLVFAILIKYLEERGNENGQLFAHDFFEQFGAADLCGVLRKGEFSKLLKHLSSHFNGRIFDWANAEEATAVSLTNLAPLADFLDANVRLENGQPSFWRRYSFNHLPVELISTVYETFLPGREDAVYTPEFLVNTLLDEVLPNSDFGRTSVRTIDVSCGSGIFLVSAFKRLVQRHRYQGFEKSGRLRRLKSKALLKIIKDNIFGVDIEKDAIRLTVFSLCLALCDELEPKEIWTELHFDDTFETNFHSGDFFKFVETADDGFDLIVGNVPFGELKKHEVEAVCKSNKEIAAGTRKHLFPRHQVGLMFLEQAPRLLKANGTLCLIVPAGPFLYNNSLPFRQHFFPRHNVVEILDFTNLGADLFNSADVATAAIFLHEGSPSDKPILHVTVRRTKSSDDKLFLEVDKYDIHYVTPDRAANDKHVWKCNLLGGGRLNPLVERYSEMPTLLEYIEKRNWTVAEGYIVGTDNSGPRKKADFITGKRSLASNALDEDGINKDKITVEEEEYFYRTGDKRAYTPPHLLIREIIGKTKIPVHLSDEYLTFKHSIFGIAAPPEEKRALAKVGKAFEGYKDLYRLLIAVTSNRYLVGKATSILKQDIMNLPYAESTDEMQMSFVEKILCDDVLQYQIELLEKGSRAKINESAALEDLIAFGNTFSTCLNSIYERKGKAFQLESIRKLEDDFIVTQFNYGSQRSNSRDHRITKTSDKVRSLIYSQTDRSFHIVRTVVLYERNKIYLVKPRSLRYWLRSVAIRDADEVFSDLLSAGY